MDPSPLASTPLFGDEVRLLTYIRIWTPAPVQDSAQQGGDRDCIRIFGFVVMRR